MAAVMAQQGLGLAPPSSRQDIVSALLNDYGNSFGRGDTSPVPAMKELPPPPPMKDDVNDKPSPRSLGGLSMKFQLRVDEESSPVSPDGSRTSPVEQPTKIVSRSLSRSSKPTSLRLLTSNGATAIPSPVPSLPPRKDSLPFSKPLEEKSLPPPPPPPEKSERRRSQQKSMASQKSQESRSRKDSIQSQEAANQAELMQKQNESTGSVIASPIVKRKALPVVGLPSGPKKFVSLAQLQNGPRGGKGGPLPPAPGSRKASVDQGIDEANVKVTQATAPPVQERPSTSAQAEGIARETSVPSQMPPTPEDDKNPLPPAPPRKAFAGGMGLPSNPRAKSSQEAGKHTRGKSSTGFDLIKASRPAPPPPAPVNTITPDLTPSPKRTEEVRMEQPISPVSPLGANGDRPFSFEMISTARPAQQQQQQQQQPPQPARPISPVSPQEISPAPAQFPPRTTSRPSPTEAIPRSTTPPAPAPAPAPAPITISVPSLAPSLQPRAIQDDEDLPPFTPLTRTPLPQPTDLIAPVTEAHLYCYTSHSTPIWSNNAFQPMGCMVCHTNDRDRKWSCAWCQLRICRACSDELHAIPGRRLDVLMERRGVVTQVLKEQETYDDDLLDDYEYDAREYDNDDDGRRRVDNTTMVNPSVVVSDMDTGRDVDFS